MATTVRIRAHGAGRGDWRGGDFSDQAVLADFAAKTFCALYRIEKDYLKPCLDARHDISEAMKTLLDFRLHTAQALTQDDAGGPVKKGFLQWLRHRV